jgi:transcriptional regulator with AAA-type ATPase domain
MFVLAPVPPLILMASEIPDLHRLRWSKRVVLVFAQQSDDPHLQQQMALLDKESSQLKERDVEMYQLVGDSAQMTRLRNQVGAAADSFAVVLLGKDGSVKLHRKELVQPSEILQLIDSMPMRRDEMKERSGK